MRLRGRQEVDQLEFRVPLQPLRGRDGDVLHEVHLPDSSAATRALASRMMRMVMVSKYAVLLPAETVPAGGGRARYVAVEALELHVGIRDPLDELVGAGRDVGRLVDLLRRLLRRDDGGRRGGGREPIDEGSVDLLHPDTTGDTVASTEATWAIVCFSGLTRPKRSREALTSAEVISFPLWNFTPRRSSKR